MSVNCRTIEKCIHRHLRGKSHEWILPTITPVKWWECDIFSLTRAMYMIEFEIKVSVADFKADFKKSLTGWDAEKFRGYPPLPYVNSRKMTDEQIEERKAEIKRRQEPVYKHDLLHQGYEQGPAYFWFATPKGLLTPDMIPEYAGLIEICEPDKYGYHAMRFKKEAPKLHKTKFDDKRLQEIKNKMHWRYMNLYFGQT